MDKSHCNIRSEDPWEISKAQHSSLTFSRGLRRTTVLFSMNGTKTWAGTSRRRSMTPRRGSPF